MKRIHFILVGLLCLVVGCSEPMEPLFVSENRDSCDLYVWEEKLPPASFPMEFVRINTNQFGVEQTSFVAKAPGVDTAPYDLVVIHGGGFDVGNATPGKEAITASNAGIGGWVVSYPRGWHEGSYDPCIQRGLDDVPAILYPGDPDRFIAAVPEAIASVKASIRYISSQTSDSLILYGSSAGASLAYYTTIYGSPGFVDSFRIAGIIAAFGGVADTLSPTLENDLPVFAIHGLRDPKVDPDIAPLYDDPIMPVGKGSRTIYKETRGGKDKWLLLHRRGHAHGPLGDRFTITEGYRAITRQSAYPPGPYGVSSTGLVPLD